MPEKETATSVLSVTDLGRRLPARLDAAPADDKPWKRPQGAEMLGQMSAQARI